MYDELIKALRDPAHSLDCEFCDSRYCHPDRKGYGKCIIIKAADAIENMSEAYDKLSRHMDDLAALMPRWIPVNERLPEPYTSVLLYSGEELYTGYMHSDKRFTVNDSRFPDRPTHWMPLPKGPKEE